MVDLSMATQRPWILAIHNGSPREERQFSDASGRPIGICHPHARGDQPAMEEAKANAALIVKTVNLHDDLVATLRENRELIAGLLDEEINSYTHGGADRPTNRAAVDPGDMGDIAIFEAALAKIDAALARVDVP